MTYFLATILFLAFGFLIFSFAKFPTKNVMIFMVVFFALMSLFISFIQPKQRKPFNLNVIEKVLKINSDGSTSIIETTTTVELKNKWKRF